ncbi:unnamed protein product [Adineta ricciae]|uniref:Helix-turn-helix domain-containing protein n=1 Tax=Adineta ricciae TaxID=249248 RepID=A0A815W471_ADIRI|nr:unnamed protein product [Adineta ricciae]CAF1647108.1 unnamed protein product [Adineta ricciae]
MLPQEESVNILTKLLMEHGVFIYEKKFYRQVVGGAMGSTFASTNEICSRYIDDVFFTSNDALGKFNKMLDTANNLHPNIKLVRNIGCDVSFWDVHIENKNGILTTSAHNKEAAEPYVVPLTSDHSKHVFGNIIHTALLRAVQYSSTLSVFEHEQRFIKLMLLYPTRFIHAQFNKFVNQNKTDQIVVNIYDSEKDFIKRRHELLNKPTIQEIAIQSTSEFTVIYPSKFLTSSSSYFIGHGVCVNLNYEDQQILNEMQRQIFFDSDLNYERLMFLSSNCTAIEYKLIETVFDWANQLNPPPDVRERLLCHLHEFSMDFTPADIYIDDDNNNRLRLDSHSDEESLVDYPNGDINSSMASVLGSVQLFVWTFAREQLRAE